MIKTILFLILLKRKKLKLRIILILVKLVGKKTHQLIIDVQIIKKFKKNQLWIKNLKKKNKLNLNISFNVLIVKNLFQIIEKLLIKNFVIYPKKIKWKNINNLSNNRFLNKYINHQILPFLKIIKMEIMII